MKFNTAILYDIENLIGGYGKNDTLSALSLKDIFDKIQEKEIGKIAIQRAYANWSNPKLNILRGDINELGIDPVQVFGFGRGSQKNAADIQLAIEAIDIAFTRNVIEIFIIVSGDGGFSSLAKKLHEYGKTVIGCAYKRTTNKIFKAVCDDFIWIEETKEDNLPKKNTKNRKSKNPIVDTYAKKHAALTNASIEHAIQEARSILTYLAKNKNNIPALTTRGLNISNFSELLDYRLNGFSYLNMGFIKFTDFIRFATYKTDIKLVHKEPSEYRLIMKNGALVNHHDVEYITKLQELHTTENYKLLLGRGTPNFKQLNLTIIYQIADYLAEHKASFQNILLSDIVDQLDEEFEFEQSEIKSSILAMVSSDCFLREPEEAKLSEQKLSFIPQNPQQAVDKTQATMKNKLEALLNDFKMEIFESVFSD